MKPLIGFLLAIFLPALGNADIAGDWAGVLTSPKATLHFVLHVKGPDSALTATADSPDQGTGGNQVDSITLSGSSLTFAIQFLDVQYSGDVNANGSIVGTFVQHGTGVPLILTRTAAPPLPTQTLIRPAGPMQGRTFHHKPTGVQFDLPPGWSVRGIEVATYDPGEMAVLAVPENKAIFASVWMHKADSFPENIRSVLDGALSMKVAMRAGKTGATAEHLAAGYKIRPGSVEHTMIGGQQALRAIGEYEEGGREITELLTWIYTEHTRTYFFLKTTPEEIAALQPFFEQLLQSARIP